MKKKLKIDLKPAIKKLHIATRDLVSSEVIGTYKSVFKGKGQEFADYRDYTPDDDASLIDWKATVRSDKLLVKEYVEERNLDIFFLINSSNSMIFGSTSKLKNEYAAELVASLAYVTLEAGDKIGFALFSDKIIKRSPPKLGKDQFYLLMKTLVNPNNYGGNIDFNKATDFLLNFLRKKTLVIIVSDFIGLKPNWNKNLTTLGNKFDVIAIIIRDPRDRTLPDYKRKVVISDPYSNKTILIDPSLAKAEYEYYVKQQERYIKQSFANAKIDFLELTTDKSFVNPIMTFFKRRALKWR